MAGSARKIDLVKDGPDFFRAKAEPALVNLPARAYLSFEGTGAPESVAFQEAVGAIYGAAFTLKFAMKAKGLDCKVAPLEGLWWVEGASGRDCMSVPRESWRWQLLTMTPERVKKADLSRALEAAAASKGEAVSEALRAVKLVRLREGACVQMLHVGPYSEEARTLEAMEAFVREKGLEFRGRHHEVYISDPRRTAPEKMKTILRHPVARAPRRRTP